MMQMKLKMRALCYSTLLVLGLAQTLHASSSMAYQDVTATVMMSSLETQPKTSFLRQLYTKLFFVPVWMQEEEPSIYARELFTRIKSDKTIDEESKLKNDAHILEEKAKAVYANNGSVVQKVDLEFKISQLYKGYADYTLYGSINWGAFQARLYNLREHQVKAEWVTYKPKYGAISLLENAVMEGSLEKLFQKSMPKEYHYKALHKSLVSYLALEKKGGWGNVPLKGKLRVSKSYNAVPALRERLMLSGDGVCDEDGNIYTKCLKDAVKHFQKRHGLVDRGVINKATIRALNVPLRQRIAKIRLNLDRIKWLHQRQSKWHIMINIPSFELFFEEDEKLIQSMRVITGRKKNPTPIFSDTVTTIVLNPHWNIPKSIIQKEMIPKLLRNSNAMARKGIEIRSGWGKDAKKINPASINWNNYRYSKTVPFHFAQKPGYRNALGKVKFLFPNQFSVYMHDTPNKRLFSRNVRAFSHGCVRLQKPRELMRTFSTFNDSVNFEKSQKQLKSSKKAYLKLENQVPVDITYLTAYVDYEGVLQFRNDIYGYDKMQLVSYRKW